MHRFLLTFCVIVTTWLCFAQDDAAVQRPNVLFCIADDWGWPHAGALGDAAIDTPTFDRLAREGVLFDHAWVSSPSCTPSRNAILTGQQFFRLREGANLWSTLSREFPVYPLLLAEADYDIGHWRKSWGPGRLAAGGYDDEHPAGPRFNGFEQFLDARGPSTPFCFWLGASDPHRPYEAGSGARAGVDVDAVQVPEFWPNVHDVRSDIADYYFEVQRFDREVGEAIALLEARGELENTIIVMTGDHGMPFPRCKGNLYDMGARVPLVMRIGTNVKLPDGVAVERGSVIGAFVSLTDLAPTFLKLAGIDAPEDMTGRSLLALLAYAGDEGWREHIIFGRERHTPAQTAPSMAGYPSRAIRTERWLYIRNFEPQRWPAGVPSGSTRGPDFSDCDNGQTRRYLMQHADDPEVRMFYDLCFARRPGEELYDVIADPFQLVNLADDPRFADQKTALAETLLKRLSELRDPRVTGEAVDFDSFPYYGQMRRSGDQ